MFPLTIEENREKFGFEKSTWFVNFQEISVSTFPDPAPFATLCVYRLVKRLSVSSSLPCLRPMERLVDLCLRSRSREFTKIPSSCSVLGLVFLAKGGRRGGIKGIREGATPRGPGLMRFGEMLPELALRARSSCLRFRRSAPRNSQTYLKPRTVNRVPFLIPSPHRIIPGGGWLFRTPGDAVLEFTAKTRGTFSGFLHASWAV